jgi:hypothetical protein
MVKQVIRVPPRRKRVTVRYRRAGVHGPGQPAATPDLPGEGAPWQGAPWEGAPWEGGKVKIEELPAFCARWGLRVVGGDPDLEGEPWAPKVYLVEG